MSGSLLTMQEGDVGSVPLADAVNHLVGTAQTSLPRPPGAKFVVFMADRGGFRIRRGNNQAVQATEFPATNVTDGSGAIYVPEGGTLQLPADATHYTVRGYASTSVLTYYWR